MKLLNAWVGLGLAFASVAPARAQEERATPSLDVGVSSGWNSPGGIYGVEGEYRLGEYFAAGAGLGKALWGLKVTPQARLYPLTNDWGLFVELGASINLGGDMTVTENGEAQAIETDTVPTVNAALGWRIDFANKWGWIGFRAGYSHSLDSEPYRATDGGDVAGFSSTVLDAITPGGPMIGIAGGVALM